jgi:hypothetical protein
MTFIEVTKKEEKIKYINLTLIEDNSHCGNWKTNQCKQYSQGQ